MPKLSGGRTLHFHEPRAVSNVASLRRIALARGLHQNLYLMDTSPIRYPVV
jgi:hypothetical protein